MVNPTAKPERFLSIRKYVELNGLSYQTVKHGLETGQLRGIQTESGNWRVDTHDGNNLQVEFVLQRLEKQEKFLLAICRQFGISVPE
ncbi:MAG: hypothetical protein FWC08_13645 [Defluviitaleaceae bacterium]|nr:hypothetical protein [Defluviitaleaceae bacterium]